MQNVFEMFMFYVIHKINRQNSISKSKYCWGWGCWDGGLSRVSGELHMQTQAEKKKFLTSIPVAFRAFSLHVSMCQRMCLKTAHVATMYMSLPFSGMLHIYLSFCTQTRVLVYCYHTNFKHFF